MLHLNFSEISLRDIGNPAIIHGKVSRVVGPKRFNLKTKLSCEKCGYIFWQNLDFPYDKLKLPSRCPDCNFTKSSCNFRVMPDVDNVTTRYNIEMKQFSSRFLLVLLCREPPNQGDLIEFKVDEIKPQITRTNPTLITSFTGESTSFTAIKKQ